MITVIPLAGRSQRFRDAGYVGHKSLLPMPDGRPMLSWIVDSIEADKLVLVVHMQDLGAFKDWLINGNGARRETVTALCVIDYRTVGPLDTILQAAEYLEDDDELLINYGDCWLDNIHYFTRRARMDMTRPAVAVFDDESGRYQRSPCGRAIGGVFYFPNSWAFLNKARELTVSDQTGAPQVAMAFEYTGEVNVTGLYHDLGTPADYEAFFRTHGKQ